jgi:hypothetical protein
MHLLRDFGRLAGGSDHYLSVGWNLKFTDLQAALGVSQTQRLPAIVSRKRAIAARYQEGLSDIPGVQMPAGSSTEVTPWFIDILVDAGSKAALVAHLHDNGVGTRPFYPPLHAEPAFAAGGSFPVATSISTRGLWLPSSLRLGDHQIDRVCHQIRSFFRYSETPLQGEASRDRLGEYSIGIGAVMDFVDERVAFVAVEDIGQKDRSIRFPHRRQMGVEHDELVRIAVEKLCGEAFEPPVHTRKRLHERVTRDGLSGAQCAPLGKAPGMDVSQRCRSSVVHAR